MASPSYELQVALVARLKSYGDLTAFIGNRVYDVVPPGADFPYVTIGEADETSDDADCIVAFEISLDIDVWTREPGFEQAKKIGDQVRRAIRSADIELVDNALVDFRHRQTRTFRDEDGLTSHSVLTFEGTIEQP
ncbi:DUF3168 domain-containing protein [Rhizobium sp. BG4]|uniref:DUF3168 domain-containing protein n=1 Tax=Rhizobium sp. BG4 TaxID=2613770 RepID=UPI00193CF429|nr:DUF3168 domain-containing protein [Rhizobium sp. BG4]QRM43986.1 DUF3168 domain-containing protein [Rhizobium sp. BG4]